MARTFIVQECHSAVKEHQRSCRQYAHVFHKDGIICVTRAFWNLPSQIQLALLLHEVGHLTIGDRPHSEEAANRAAERFSGVPIEYRDTPYGDNLECIQRRDIAKARRALGIS